MDENNSFPNILSHQEATNYAAGQTVFEAGARGDSMFLVIEGEIEIRLGDVQLESARAGQIFRGDGPDR
jgi:CRP-like cAMP-binding protein